MLGCVLINSATLGGTVRDNSKQVRPETLGLGVFDPAVYQVFSPDEETVMGVYADGIDIRHVIVRNFEPGQGNPLHVHPENAHCIYVLEGSGHVLRPGGPPVPIAAGQVWIVPRGVEHGIENTGSVRLSYLGVTAGREPAGARAAG
jgi:mannose-6-phosphate isomerase-like protein (cupin superfamily)